MARAHEVSEHLGLSRSYLATALDSLEQGRVEPALFNAYHALELACKAALLARTGEMPRTHHVGGLFGARFRKEAGAEVCQRITEVLAKYNLPRYPGTRAWTRREAERDIAFIRRVVEEVVPGLLGRPSLRDGASKSSAHRGHQERSG